MTLEKIRATLPTHIMLTPGVHRWRDGDEEYIDSEENFMEIDPHYDGYIVDHEGSRRPIPQHILDNQAYYLWLDGFADITSGKFTRAEMDRNESEGRLYDKWLLEQMEVGV